MKMEKRGRGGGRDEKRGREKRREKDTPKDTPTPLWGVVSARQDYITHFEHLGTH